MLLDTCVFAARHDGALQTRVATGRLQSIRAPNRPVCSVPRPPAVADRSASPRGRCVHVPPFPSVAWTALASSYVSGDTMWGSVLAMGRCVLFPASDDLHGASLHESLRYSRLGRPHAACAPPHGVTSARTLFLDGSCSNPASCFGLFALPGCLLPLRDVGTSRSQRDALSPLPFMQGDKLPATPPDANTPHSAHLLLPSVTHPMDVVCFFTTNDSGKGLPATDERLTLFPEAPLPRCAAPLVLVLVFGVCSHTPTDGRVLFAVTVRRTLQFVSRKQPRWMCMPCTRSTISGITRRFRAPNNHQPCRASACSSDKPGALPHTSPPFHTRPETRFTRTLLQLPEPSGTTRLLMLRQNSHAARCTITRVVSSCHAGGAGRWAFLAV